ncbi:MAG: nonstructural protein [Microvirus sp.]|nr:MAG: nonstructural protein [Microvirus sp.]
MKYIVCVVRDTAAEVYGQPMFLASRGQAIRSFTDEVNRVEPNNTLNKHPADFILFTLGGFDDGTGVFDCGEPVQLMRGIDAIRSE